jgi:2,4-dienoyl-CoA reductase (NADPH2)
MLADPELARKLTDGHAHRIRTCISCENCIDAMEQRFSVDCAVNPRTGKERELAVRPTKRVKNVIVIGGGPAGMEAARVASQRGHQVTLFDREHQTGGALRWASLVHPENEPFLDYLRNEIAMSSVKVGLGQDLSANDVVDLQPDAVVVATGALVVQPVIEGSDLCHVRSGSATVRAMAKGLVPEGRRVTIVGADLGALEIAEFLAARKRLVSILEPGKTIAPLVGNKRRTEHMDRLDRAGVTVHVRVSVDRITPDGVAFTPHGGTSRQLHADNVIVVGALKPNTELYEKLVTVLPDAHVVAAGDCTGAGLIRKATEDGARAACTI